MRVELERAGRVADPDGEGLAGSDRCGDRVRFTLRLRGGTIEQIRFGVQGCPSATGAAAELARRVEGGSLLAAAAIPLDALDVPSRECGAIAHDALHAALADALGRVQLVPDERRRIVAMSGGVDSAIALHRERAAGHEVVGLTLRLWIDEHAPDAERACCSPTAVVRARETCHALGVPHFSIDAQDAFREAVVEPFVRGYASGETPNPCTTCNAGFRLDLLVESAARLGSATVATGHYARIVRRGGRAFVARGADRAKDQSYMLARVDADLLGHLALPLGDARKPDVRAEASAAGLAQAALPESQDICFLGGGALAPFLERAGVRRAPGAIEAEDGRVLGEHAGALSFTPGQRRGLGVAAAEPLFVQRIDAGRNVVVLAPRERLARLRVELREARVADGCDRAYVKLRGRSPAVATAVSRADGGIVLDLDEPVYGIAPGQTAALYDEQGVVIGSGVIAG